MFNVKIFSRWSLVLLLLCFSVSTFSSLPSPTPLTSPDCSQVGADPGQYCITVQFSGGRLGNQLFEVATALSEAQDHHCLAVFPMFKQRDRWGQMDLWGFDVNKLFAPYLDDEKDAIFSSRRLPHRDVSHLNCFPNKFVETTSIDREDYSRVAGSKMPVIIEGMPLKTILASSWSRREGWGMFKFMSYKLFHHNEHSIQETLGPSQQQKEELLDKFAKLGVDLRKQTVASVHVRHGDRARLFWRLLYPPTHPSYYKRAIEKMEQLTQVPGQKKIDVYMVFSDDIDFARDLMRGEFPQWEEQGKLFFVDWRKFGNTDYQDLWLMSLAQHNIIGNSTYSFWGAYLNQHPDKIVLFPRQWLGPVPRYTGLHWQHNGICPPEWIQVH